MSASQQCSSSQQYQDPHGHVRGHQHFHHPHRDHPHGSAGCHDDSRREPSPPSVSSDHLRGHHHCEYGHPTPALSSHHPNPLLSSSVSRQRQSNALPPIPASNATVGSSGPSIRSEAGVLLLAQPDDRISLSETLCVVRENIEVFTATEKDIKAPAPGRKRPVVVGQIGLRCIHCRTETKPGSRVKRAVCFPSSIKRIYRTVIDMKLDHFKSCVHVPDSLKNRLAELKANNARSTGTTMQYFVQAANRMGMADGPNGVCYDPRAVVLSSSDGEEQQQAKGSVGPPHTAPQNRMAEAGYHHQFHSDSIDSGHGHHHLHHPHHHPDLTRPIALSHSMSTAERSYCSIADSSGGEGEGGQRRGKHSIFKKKRENEGLNGDSRKGHDGKLYTGQILLSLPEDITALSPLRCFLRENVYAFSATAEDIAVRTPTTFSVVLGQVGIGCIHCYSLPAKERSNRAVCFPFSISRIYQSVADIQRFHLAECRVVPSGAREKFQALQSASSKGSKGLATRQYWVTSAKKLGLVDTVKGIRFCRDPSEPIAPALSLDILARVASDVTTASKPLVLPEDRPQIAEFLYVVMEQLQPCRFTEADRNKRRMKDVGCVGVECRHCAGQVESRKFFWSSVNAVESNFVSVHTHMMECRLVPDDTKEQLGELKKLRKEQTAQLKTGSQKAFFARVWERLHAEDTLDPTDASPQSPTPPSPLLSSTSSVSSLPQKAQVKKEATESSALDLPSPEKLEQKRDDDNSMEDKSAVKDVRKDMSVIAV